MRLSPRYTSLPKIPLHWLLVLCITSPLANLHGQETSALQFPGKTSGNKSASTPASKSSAQPGGKILSGGPQTAGTPQSKGPSTSDAKTESSKSDERLRSYVTLPTSLQSLYRASRAPRTLNELQLLEKQLQLVSERTKPCTINLTMGPAQGGGVIVSPEGYILTAAHVAQRPGQIAIAHLHDGRTVRVRSLGMNREFDAGVMKILENQNSGNAWPHAAMGNSESLRLGSWCVAMGHPGGLDRERGTVARVGRVLENGSDAIVTDCALISGDSGGPLFDLKGRLIAVHSRIGNDIAANLHVPVDRYEDHWDRMVKGEAWGFLPNFKPWLGVSGSTSTETAMLKRVTPGSPAAKAGLKSEDIVLRFGATRISDFKSLLDAVAQTMPGEQVRVRVQRELRILDLNIEIGRQDDK